MSLLLQKPSASGLLWRENLWNDRLPEQKVAQREDVRFKCVVNFLGGGSLGKLQNEQGSLAVHLPKLRLSLRQEKFIGAVIHFLSLVQAPFTLVAGAKRHSF